MTQSFFRQMADIVGVDDHVAIEIFIKEDKSRLEEDTTFAGTALHYAASEGAIECAKQLIELGADINLIGESESSPLLCAVRGGNLLVIGLLLDHGAKPASDECLYVSAITKGDAEVVKFLLDSGVDPHSTITRFNGELRNGYSHAI